MLFLGGFVAAALILGCTIYVIRRKIRRFSAKALGNPNILEALENLDFEIEEMPRSLSGCDNLLLPKILEDFPDFDPLMAKTYAKDYLHKQFGHKESFVLYNVVISKYHSSAVQKTIVFQAAISWMEKEKRIQKRFDLNYTYLLSSNQDTIAANCPNCGGAVSYGEIQCAYCGSRIANILGNTWEFTQLQES